MDIRDGTQIGGRTIDVFKHDPLRRRDCRDEGSVPMDRRNNLLHTGCADRNGCIADSDLDSAFQFLPKTSENFPSLYTDRSQRQEKYDVSGFPKWVGEAFWGNTQAKTPCRSTLNDPATDLNP